MFEISKRDGLARLGKIKTSHGVLETPTLLPVVNPKILTLSMEDLAECGAQGIITNSYIIYKNLELKKIAEEKGVHELVNWSGKNEDFGANVSNQLSVISFIGTIFKRQR